MTIYRPGQHIYYPGNPGVRVVQPGGAAAVPWYLSGGIAAASCVAAYQPKGAASLAASYTNLNAPGTNDAVPLVVPGWDAVNGWDALASTGCLQVGAYGAVNTIYSVAIRFTAGAAWSRYCSSPINGGLFTIAGAFGTNRIFSVGGSERVVAGAITAGVLALASPGVGGAATGYVNGVGDPTFVAGNFAVGTNFFIGKCKIQAYTLHNICWTTAQALAICTAMAAL